MRYTLNNFVVPFVKIIEGDDTGEAQCNLAGQYFTIIQDAKCNGKTTDISGIYTAILKKNKNLGSLETGHEKAAYEDLMTFFNLLMKEEFEMCFEIAVGLSEAAATLGFVPALNQLYHIIEDRYSRSITPVFNHHDYEKRAISYLKQTAENSECQRIQGQAQYLLGLMHYSGYGASWSTAKAMGLFRQSEENDNLNAKYALGYLYAEKKFYTLRGRTLENYHEAISRLKEFVKDDRSKKMVTNASDILEKLQRDTPNNYTDWINSQNDTARLRTRESGSKQMVSHIAEGLEPTSQRDEGLERSTCISSFGFFEFPTRQQGDFPSWSDTVHNDSNL